MISASTAAALVLLQLLSAAQNQIGVLGQPPSCPTSCGNVNVPYPFGIGGAGCFLPGFNLTCDRKHQPPRLLLSNGALQVVEISLANSTVRVMNSGGTVNFVYRGVVDDNGTWAGVGVGSPYIVSERRNQFVVTGCNIMAMLVGDNRNVISCCSSFCSISDRWDGAIVTSPNGTGDTTCSGIGCCESSITIGRPSYRLQFKWLDRNHQYDGELPIAVRIAERGWFDGVSAELLKTSGQASSRPTAPTAVPVVLEWVVASTPVPPGVYGNWTCPKDAASSECRSSHSSCRNVTNNYRSGYVCECQYGYQGNPYVTNGCEDIDECALPDKCFGKCTNTPGGYVCRCPRGARGNPRTRDGCVKSSLG